MKALVPTDLIADEDETFYLFSLDKLLYYWLLVLSPAS